MTSTSTQNRIAVEILSAQKPTCGDCSGFRYDKLIGGKQKTGCETEFNKTEDCVACNKFAPDVRQLEGFVGTSSFDAFSNLIAAVDSKGLKVLSALLRVESTTRLNGFRFGQKVYVRYRGRANSDYMSNFMSAYVMAVNKHYIRLIGKDGRCVLTYTRDSMPSLYTPEQFEPLRHMMEKKGRRIDPDVRTTTSKRLRYMEEIELDMVDDSLNGNVTTIDTVFRENNVKRKKSEVYDLVAVVGELMQGFDNRNGKGIKRSAKKDKDSSIKTVRKSGSRVDLLV